MTCLVCSRRAQLFLCGHCVHLLDTYLDNLPWLLNQLDVTLQRQDQLSCGSIGGRSSDTPSPINFDALDTSTAARKTLAKTIRALLIEGEKFAPINTAPRDFIGPLPAGWRRIPPHYVLTAHDYATWLQTHRHRIPRNLNAGDIFRDLRNLADPNHGDSGGTLLTAINRNERRYYGPCTHTTGRDHGGQTRECGADIYGPRDADMVTCPDCGVSVSAQNQLDQTEARTDLRTMDTLIDTMRNLGETVGRNRVQTWINKGQLQRRGYYNQDRGITKKRVRQGDPAVYSLTQARQLREHAHQKAGQR